MPLFRTVDSSGVRLAVREHSPPGPDRPTVVLVHGYPDQQDVWDRVVAKLPTDRWHVVTYDVRGAGVSDAPEKLADYQVERLVADLAAVLTAVLPVGGAAHLVGHDWGSVQLWEAVGTEQGDPRLHGRIASFTSISGPSISHVAWLVRHPAGRRLRLARQLVHSWYVYFFLIPRLPELLWRWTHRPLLPRLLNSRYGDPPDWRAQRGRNGERGLQLYRANVGRGSRGGDRQPSSVPVLVIHPTRDRFVTDVLLEDLDRLAADVRVTRVDAGHWVTRTHPDEVAALVTEHVARCELHRPPPRGTMTR